MVWLSPLQSTPAVSITEHLSVTHSISLLLCWRFEPTSRISIWMNLIILSFAGYHWANGVVPNTISADQNELKQYHQQPCDCILCKPLKWISSSVLNWHHACNNSRSGALKWMLKTAVPHVLIITYRRARGTVDHLIEPASDLKMASFQWISATIIWYFQWAHWNVVVWNVRIWSKLDVVVSFATLIEEIVHCFPILVKTQGYKNHDVDFLAKLLVTCLKMKTMYQCYQQAKTEH